MEELPQWIKDRECSITSSKDVIDDVAIEFNFGFSYSKEEERRFDNYYFPNVKEEVAEQILDYIQSLMPEGKSIDDYYGNPHKKFLTKGQN